MKRKMAFLVIAVEIFIIFILGLFLIYKIPDNNGIVACTEEALLCPDGSYVARSGARCQFESCPNMGWIEGALNQDKGNFYLIIDSPEKWREVSYYLPLKLKSNDLLSQIIDKNVQVVGTFESGNTLFVNYMENTEY